MLARTKHPQERPPQVALEVSRDVAAFNAIANDPSILPHIVVEGSVDLAAYFECEDNLGFMGDGCAFLAHCLEPAVYEVHSMALPHARGANVMAAAKQAITHMFIATPARELLTRVVVDNRRAAGLAMHVGFTPEFARLGAWAGKDVSFMALRYPEWIKRQDWLRGEGQWFHDALGDHKTHDEDPAHDLHVGSCVAMVKAGNADKGVILYNRWARFAGYETVEIIDRDPLTIDIRSHVVTFDNGEMTCR